jgi:hypothetical protein
MHVRSYAQITPFRTLDGSEIREWAGRVHNIGLEPLRLLCACSPPYSDEDTVLLE